MNDRAWNEYIKKGLNFIEFGTFKSTTVRAQREWPSQMFSSSPCSSPRTFSSSVSSLQTIHVPTTTTIINRSCPPVTTTTVSTLTRIPSKERRNEREKDIAEQALKLANTSVHDAMDLVRSSMPDKFLAHSSW